MNNTQQSGETVNMVRKEVQHLISMFNTVLVEWDGKDYAMVDICVECMRRIESSQAAPTLAPDAVEAKAERTFLDTLLENYQIAKSAAHEPEVAFPGMSKMEAVLEVYEDMIELYKAWESASPSATTYTAEDMNLIAKQSYEAAGHAEGQKATVEAKPLRDRMNKAVEGNMPEPWIECLVFCEGMYEQVEGYFVAKMIYISKTNKKAVGMDAYNNGLSYITHWLPLEQIPTPTSHAEGENDPWISVKDRLPEDQEELVITTVIRNKDGKRFVVLDRRKTFNDYVFDTVTHWMPLPPPAK